MLLSPATLPRLGARARVLKAPGRDAPAAQHDPAVAARVSQMLSTIERDGLDAVLRYARELDGHTGDGVASLEMTPAQVAAAGDALPAPLRAAVELGAARTRAFAAVQREGLRDVEVELVPGVVTGARHVPVGRVGAYLPAGRFPLTASAFMTVGVAKAAGVPHVLACTPPQPGGGANPAVVHAAAVSGADRVVVLGGVQALAAMAFGLLGDDSGGGEGGGAGVDMLVGAGNAYVAEAKRQLFGRVAIDLPAGPSEVAVLADATADAELVAADLLGQAEHGPTSPAALVTTDEALGLAVVAEVERQLAVLPTRDVAGPAWRDFGSVHWAADREAAAALVDDLAPEHLEVITADDAWYHDRLTSYGSLFLGAWSTVAYSDKGMAGTNHTLPTAGGAKHSGGLSVARFLKCLTYQRIAREATPALADAVVTISESEGMAAHAATAALRTRRLAASAQPA